MSEALEKPELPKDCWVTIGVAGDRSCPELQERRHCRNCPRYVSLAAEMLDRKPPPGYVHEWTDVLAKEKEIEVRGAASAVVFEIDHELLALTTEIFQEVAEGLPVHSVPHRTNSVFLGLVSVRGEITLCVSIASLLGLEEPGRERRRLAVVRNEGERWAAAVDSVHGIVRFNPEDLIPPPVNVSKAAATFTRGVLDWLDRPVGYLDEKLLFEAFGRSLL